MSCMISSSRKGLASWLSFVMSYCEVVNFPLDLGQVRCLIVSIPDLCPLSYFLVYFLCYIIIRAYEEKVASTFNPPPPHRHRKDLELYFFSIKIRIEQATTIRILA